MVNKALAVSVAVSLSLAGCASQPEKIATQYVSPLAYKDFSCEQIASEMQRTSRRQTELQVQLKKLADDDQTQMAVGAILFLPVLFFLEGGDGAQAAEYSRLKGEYEALQSVAVQKNCSLPVDAYPARWISVAQTKAREVCPTAGNPSVISREQDMETFNFACTAGNGIVVRCESGACRNLE